MAITRKARKPDIRSLSITSLSKQSDAPTQATEVATPAFGDPTIHYSLADLKRVLWCSLPLVILLFVASYLDATRPWVISLADRLFSIGG